MFAGNGPADLSMNKGPEDQMYRAYSEDDGKTWRGGLMLDERADVTYPDGRRAERVMPWRDALEIEE